MSKPDISIIIVNWKVRALLDKCLSSIFTQTKDINLQVIVVDNDSEDGTAEMVMTEYPQVEMISLASNHGFAKANNLGLQRAKSDLMFLLNPDTELSVDFLEKAIDYMERNKQVDILAPKILNPDKSIQYSIRKSPNLISQILVLLKMRNILLNNKILRHYLGKDFDYEKEQTVEQVMGAAMIVRRSVFDKIGYLDENYFIWFEEVDFCLQAKKAGLNIMYWPKIYLTHHEGASFSKKRIIRKQLIFNKSILYYFWKNKPFWQWLVILLFIPINIVLTIMYVVFLSEKKL